jgi:plastocyanin
MRDPIADEISRWVYVVGKTWKANVSLIVNIVPNSPEINESRQCGCGLRVCFGVEAKESPAMSIRLHSVIIASTAAALFVACDHGPAQSTSPSTVEHAQSAPIAGPAQSAAKSAAQHVVALFDACDPETFDAALGAGTCTRSGGVRFATFLEQLGRHGSIGAWRFAPSEVTMQVGQMLVATNRGGETHTFTEVEEFGGGIVPQLNALTGLATIAPECGQLEPGDFLGPDASSMETEEDAGVEKYQCCIHPWMRAEVRVAAK